MAPQHAAAPNRPHTRRHTARADGGLGGAAARCGGGAACQQPRGLPCTLRTPSPPCSLPGDHGGQHVGQCAHAPAHASANALQDKSSPPWRSRATQHWYFSWTRAGAGPSVLAQHTKGPWHVWPTRRTAPPRLVVFGVPDSTNVAGPCRWCLPSCAPGNAPSTTCALHTAAAPTKVRGHADPHSLVCPVSRLCTRPAMGGVRPLSQGRVCVRPRGGPCWVL